jgi:pimeloyl-ACP methyl ester carboxylesterase
MQNPWRDVSITSDDGLKLYGRDYGPENADKCPVLCLAGLTRNSKDFHHVAMRLAHERRVIAPDYRGRGLSEYASDWHSYEPDVELNDAIKLLAHLDIDKVVVIGTSRGGLISMLMAHLHKQKLCGVILNDIGPKIDDEGLIRISDSINEKTAITSWAALVDGLKAYNTGLKGLSETEWMEFAHNCYREIDGNIVPDYDFNLTRTFPSSDLVRAGKIPEVWDLFDALNGLPVGVVRGANSDLLSEATVDKMERRHRGLIRKTIADRAHVPFLNENGAIDVIDQILALADKRCTAP